jgi:hypothetical protein
VQYLPLFLLFMAVLIFAYFYLQRAKGRDAGNVTSDTVTPSETGPVDTPQ